jgi:DNA-binding NarL/FixJ family response regulator
LAVIGEAGEGAHALNLIATLKPDVVLLDLSMPGMHGTEILRQVRISNPKVKCLVLTSHLSEPIVRAAIQAGAAGYLLKDTTRTELITAIYSVAKGRTYISPLIADKVLPRYVGMPASSKRKTTPWQILSEREQGVFKYVAEGATNKAIAAALNISVRTVEKHRASLMSKLNLRTTAALTAYAIEHELVTSDAVLKYDRPST